MSTSLPPEPPRQGPGNAHRLLQTTFIPVVGKHIATAARHRFLALQDFDEV